MPFLQVQDQGSALETRGIQNSEGQSTTSSSSPRGCEGRPVEPKPSFHFSADYAKSGRSLCVTCSKKIEDNKLRLARIVVNPFSHSSALHTQPANINRFYHPACLFDSFKRVRSLTLITAQSQIENFGLLTTDDQNLILAMIE